MIEMTPRAVENIRGIRDKEGDPGAALRVSTSGGGCSGLTYNLKFDKEIGPLDKVFESDGVKIIVDAKSYLYLNGMTLDFTEGLNGKGFVFNNPNAKSTCGCGESFSV